MMSHTKDCLVMTATDACHSDFCDTNISCILACGMARVKLTVSTMMPKQCIDIVGATNFFMEISKPMWQRSDGEHQKRRQSYLERQFLRYHRYNS